MTPQFTTPCYVRVEDKDKRKKVCELLEELEYWCACVGRLRDDVVITHDAEYLVDYRLTDEDIGVDCGTNTELFLALASMRSDTDKGQWVIEKHKNHKDKWVFCGCTKAPKSTPSKTITKATAQEIIEHFNNKQ